MVISQIFPNNTLQIFRRLLEYIGQAILLVIYIFKTEYVWSGVR